MDHYLSDFSETSSDDTLIEIFDSWLKESQTYHDEMLKKQKVSYDYYVGAQTDMDRVPRYLSNTVENRIFEAVETITPIITGNAHQFQVTGGQGDESKEKADRLQKWLTRKYESLEMQRRLEDVARNILVFRFGVMKWHWDAELDDVGIKVIDPRLILVPRLRLDPHDLPYTMEIQGYSKDEMEENFPDVNLEELGKGSHQVDTGKSGQYEKKDEYQAFEVWTAKAVAWICNKQVLKKMANPYYDFDGEVKKEIIPETGQRRKVRKFFNHVKEPEKPYVFFQTFNLSDGPFPPTSLVEIGIPIQDSINVQKRGIINNLKQMGNSQWVVDAGAMTQEEADNITNEPGLVVRGTDIASGNRFKREPGVPIPNAHFSNLQHSEMVFDNIMGVHSATRGKADAATLGQDILSRQQDYTRVDTLTRVLNRGVARVARGLVQLMKRFYTESHFDTMTGEDGESVELRLSRADIEDGTKIVVKSGQNLPMDELSLRTEAVQLWQLGGISPVTLFERLKFPNPAKEAERLMAFRAGQLDMETQAKIRQMQAEASLQAPQGENLKGGGNGVAPTSKGGGFKEAEGRKTESIQNVLMRARQQFNLPVDNLMEKAS